MMDNPHLRAVSPVSDDTLVDAARNGDSAAIEQLLRNNYERIYTLCRRICRSREQAEDATQNTLIAIVRGLAGFDGRSKFSTWCYRIATNCTLDELRRDARQSTLALDHDLGSDEPGSIGSPSPISAYGVDPLDSVVASETRRELARALDSLDERFRVPLVLREVAELDYSEIGELLGLAPGTVRSRLSRARRHLGDILTGTALDEQRLSGVTADHSESAGNQTETEIVKPGET